MANDVFANGREISCKSGAGKSICAFPDVCFTPPENPATPPGVPVPYPNTGMDTDTTSGSRTVKITGKEVMLKNKSYFRQSTGDEAGCAAKKGVVTSVNRGKVYFVSWSMDVKFESENIVRHLDMTTHNHASFTANTPPWMFLDTMAIAPPDHPCREEIDEAQKACKGAVTTGCGPSASRDCSKATGDCQQKMVCILVPKDKDKELCCAPHNTGHHMVGAHCCKGVVAGYKSADAPTVCAGGWSWYREQRSGIAAADQTHADFHEIQDPIERKILRVVGKLIELGNISGVTKERPWKYRTVRNISITAHKKTFPEAGCSNPCLGAQLDQYHNSVGITASTPLAAKEFGNKISVTESILSELDAKIP